MGRGDRRPSRPTSSTGSCSTTEPSAEARELFDIVRPDIGASVAEFARRLLRRVSGGHHQRVRRRHALSTSPRRRPSSSPPSSIDCLHDGREHVGADGRATARSCRGESADTRSSSCSTTATARATVDRRTRGRGPTCSPAPRPQRRDRHPGRRCRRRSGGACEAPIVAVRVAVSPHRGELPPRRRRAVDRAGSADPRRRPVVRQRDRGLWRDVQRRGRARPVRDPRRAAAPTSSAPACGTTRTGPTTAPSTTSSHVPARSRPTGCRRCSTSTTPTSGPIRAARTPQRPGPAITDVDELADALGTYTTETLATARRRGRAPRHGADRQRDQRRAASRTPVGLDWDHDLPLFDAGHRGGAGGRRVDRPGRSRSCSTSPSRRTALDWFEQAADAGLTDFDVIGLSYYPQWSRFSIAELGSAVQSLADGLRQGRARRRDRVPVDPRRRR